MALLTYPNGLRLNVNEMPELNTATICIDLLGGYQGETQLLNGTCELISRLLMCGTQKYPTAMALSNFAKSKGITLDISTHKEYIQILINCLKTDIEIAIEFVNDILFNSLFKTEYINLIKSQIKSEIEMNKLNPSFYLNTLTNQALFARTGLMNTKIGNLKSIDRITKVDILNLYEKYLTPKNMVISVGGAVDGNLILKLVGELFYNKLQNTEYKQIKYVSKIDNFEGFINIKNRPYNQSRIEVSFPGISFKENNKFALDIISKALENELKIRLAAEEYFKSIQIESVNYANNGKLVIALLADSEYAEAFLGKVLIELKDILKNNGVSKDEFVAEKNSYITNFVLASEKSEELTKLCAKELIIAKQEFILNDKFNILDSITYESAYDILKSVVNFNKINIVYLGPSTTLESLKDIIIG